MATDKGSISRWFGPLQEGDPAAAQELWERYFSRMVELARKQLHLAPQRESAEDVALSAFDAFCRGASDGRFPRLDDRDSLWSLLVVITTRKAARHARDAGRQKRGGDLTELSGSGAELRLQEIVSREPAPDFAAEAAEECQRLLRLLADPELEKIALLKMEGHCVEEIGRQLGYVPRTIKRKMRLIRTLWEQEMES